MLGTIVFLTVACFFMFFLGIYRESTFVYRSDDSTYRGWAVFGVIKTLVAAFTIVMFLIFMAGHVSCNKNTGNLTVLPHCDVEKLPEKVK